MTHKMTLKRVDEYNTNKNELIRFDESNGYYMNSKKI